MNPPFKQFLRAYGLYAVCVLLEAIVLGGLGLLLSWLYKIAHP